MDGVERTEAAFGASPGQGTSGTGQSVFRGRRVSTTSAAERTYQPYSVADCPGRPNASHSPESGPSAALGPHASSLPPKSVARFRFKLAYKGIVAGMEADTLRGDTYAVAASASALGEIDQAVKDAFSTYRRKTDPAESNTEDAMARLRKIQANARRYASTRSGAIEQSMNHIRGLTLAKKEELMRRREEFRSASFSLSAPVPGRDALGQWLQRQADAAHGSRLEHEYFTQLAKELPCGRDPWTVSRELIGRLPIPGNAEQAALLQAAHGRLVQAIAGGLSEQPVEPGGRKPITGYRWKPDYEAIKLRCETDRAGSDFYAAAASASALEEIRQATMSAYSKHITKPRSRPAQDPAERMARLMQARDDSYHRYAPLRGDAIQRSLDDIRGLTRAKKAELMRRSDEFRSASLSHTAPVPGRDALGQWLQRQAEAAHGSRLEHEYFTQLARELPRGGDPWTVSQELIGRLPIPGNAEQAALLQIAHGRLVQAIAGGLSEHPSEPGDREPENRYMWQPDFDLIKTGFEEDTAGSDIYAAAASASALGEIDRAVKDAYFTHRRRATIDQAQTGDLMQSLRTMRTHARSRDRVRYAAIERSLEGIYGLTRAKKTELMRRRYEFRSAPLLHSAPVPRREALGQWLQGRADAAHGSRLEHEYFTQLARESLSGRDPWTVSRELIGRLPRPGDAGQAARLQAAHGSLVQAMAGRPGQQAPVPAPDTAPAVVAALQGSQPPVPMR